MQVPAKADYAIRALLELAAANGELVAGSVLAQAQQIPPKFLEAILSELRRSGIVVSLRGPEGGYRLARPAESVSLADVIRAVDGPLAQIRGVRPEAMSYDGAAENLRDVWLAVRVALRKVLEEVSLADVVAGKLPSHVRRLLGDPDTLVSH